jgi:hypothetical protein
LLIFAVPLSSVALMLGVLVYLLLSASSALRWRNAASLSSVELRAFEFSNFLGQQKKLPKNTDEPMRNEAGTRIEMRFPPLEIQEYLQAFVRKQQWKISEENLTEDSWVFSRSLSRDELLKNTKKNAAADTVDWASGVAVIRVNTVQLSGGIARTSIRVAFRGYGQSSDQFAMQREYWDLESNETLENFLISALTGHFREPH